MTKPLSPNQVKLPKIGSPEHRKHLKKVVTRRLNQELKKGVRLIRVENHIDDDLADEIAKDYEGQGWEVIASDHREMASKWGWYFTFSVLFAVGDDVMVDMIDRESWPEVFPAKVIDVEQASLAVKRYLIEWEAGSAPRSLWVIDRYLTKAEK